MWSRVLVYSCKCAVVRDDIYNMGVRVYAFPCFFAWYRFRGGIYPTRVGPSGKYFSPGEFPRKSRKSRNPEKKQRNHYRRNVSGFSKSRKLTPVMVSLVFFGISGFSGFRGNPRAEKFYGRWPVGEIFFSWRISPKIPKIPKSRTKTAKPLQA